MGLHQSYHCSDFQKCPIIVDHPLGFSNGLFSVTCRVVNCIKERSMLDVTELGGRPLAVGAKAGRSWRPGSRRWKFDDLHSDTFTRCSGVAKLSERLERKLDQCE